MLLACMGENADTPYDTMHKSGRSLSRISCLYHALVALSLQQFPHVAVSFFHSSTFPHTATHAQVPVFVYSTSHLLGGDGEPSTMV